MPLWLVGEIYKKEILRGDKANGKAKLVDAKVNIKGK